MVVSLMLHCVLAAISASNLQPACYYILELKTYIKIYG